MKLLTQINKESLVFLYNDQKSKYPNVLFTADSDLGFLNEITLSENSIVTAPHHGSDDNSGVYKKIIGENLIYVRSDRSQVARPCHEYIKLERKYCTICRNRGKKQQVLLQYHNGQWNTSNNLCNC